MYGLTKFLSVAFRSPWKGSSQLDEISFGFMAADTLDATAP